jgi:hypothetical protein
MLKERLRRVHPAFIWEKVEQYPRLDARTVTPDLAIARLKNIANVSLSAKDEQTLRTLRITRNTIEHYEWHASEMDARVIVGKALSFAIFFAGEHLGVDLAKPFMADDTWKVLLDDLFEFTSEHMTRLEERLSESGIPAMECVECGAATVSLLVNAAIKRRHPRFVLLLESCGEISHKAQGISIVRLERPLATLGPQPGRHDDSSEFCRCCHSGLAS